MQSPDFDSALTREEQQAAAREANALAAVFVREEGDRFAAAVRLYYDLLRCKAVIEKVRQPGYLTLQEEKARLQAENTALRQELKAAQTLAESHRQAAAKAEEQHRLAALEQEKQIAALQKSLETAQKAAKAASMPEETLLMENERLRGEIELHLQTIRTQSTQLRRLRLQSLQHSKEPDPESEGT